MTPAEFIDDAIDRGQSMGVERLTELQRLVFLISEAEVYCTKDGIDSFIDRYGSSGLAQAARAFATVGASELAAVLDELARGAPPYASEPLLERANELVANHIGWDYDAIHTAVAHRLTA